MNPLQIVIDTNVIVAAFRSQRGASYALLHSIGDVRWELNISVTLALEYETVIKRELKRQNRPLTLADEAVDALIAAANRVNIACRYRPELPDPSDDFILELAVESESSYVVTYNIKDFRGLERYDVRAIRPGAFLRMLEEAR